MITEKEFEVINIIATDASSTQRGLASKTDMSLGMVNVLLKRLILKGYLRAQQLNRKKMRYLLTPKGFAEKTLKSYHYTAKTISSLKTIRSGLETIVNESYRRGTRDFWIVGQGDLADLLEITLRDLNKPEVRYHRTLHAPGGKLSDASLILVTGKELGLGSSKHSWLNVTKSLSEIIVPRAFSPSYAEAFS